LLALPPGFGGAAVGTLYCGWPRLPVAALLLGPAAAAGADAAAGAAAALGARGARGAAGFLGLGACKCKSPAYVQVWVVYTRVLWYKLLHANNHGSW
jgi:hypothetical protein